MEHRDCNYCNYCNSSTPAVFKAFGGMNMRFLPDEVKEEKRPYEAQQGQCIY